MKSPRSILLNRAPRRLRPLLGLPRRALAYLRPARVTTLLTSYNEEAYLDEAMRSAIAQKGPIRHEILALDDGSTDGSPAIVARHAAAHPGLVRDLGSKTNLGISANMRRGIEAARGEFIAVLEGDDIWTDPHKLDIQVDFLRRHPECPMCFSRLIIRDEIRGVTMPHRFQPKNLPSLLTAEDFLRDGRISLVGGFSTCLFRAKFLREIPEVLYESRLSEVPLSFHLLRFGPIGFVRRPLSIYRVRKGSIWGGATKEQKREQALTCRLTALKVCAPEVRPRLREIVERKYGVQVPDA